MDDETSGIIIGIVIFILLAIFVLAIFIGVEFSSSPTNNQQVAVQMGQILAPCATTTCATGLECDGNSFSCKFGPGLSCLNATECVTGLICSGRCATGATGGLNNLCPCDAGFICTSEIDGFTRCKGGAGIHCLLDSDCASGFCDGGRCTSGSPNAFPCTTNASCGTRNCSKGFCQNPGVVTGVLGAACAGSCVGYTGAVCNSTVTAPLTCECIGGTNFPGTCVTTDQGILSPCSNVSPCGTDLICFNISGAVCGNLDDGCLCTFPYDDPNAQAPGSNCIGGMSFDSQGCFNNAGFGCDSGSNCINKVCGGTASTLAFYRFSVKTTSNLLTRFPGATNTAMLKTFGPPGLIHPYKMFATSSGTVDNIYLVDYIQGLLLLRFNSVTQVVVSPWTQLIPYHTSVTVGNTTTEKTLVDADYNGTTFIVAFNEVVTVSGVPTQNDTVYSGTVITNLTPFNVQSGFTGLPGTQFTTGGVALSINYIDISPPNDMSMGGDTLISINGTIYIRANPATLYSIGVIKGGSMNGTAMTGLTGPSRFYFDNTASSGTTGMCPGDGMSPADCPSADNVSLVGPFRGPGVTGLTAGLLQVLQFSGNVAGIAFPLDRFDGVQYKVFDYSIYSPPVIGMPNAGIVMLVNAYLGSTFIDTIVAASFGGITTFFPYRISNNCRSVATANAFYVISLGSCS